MRATTASGQNTDQGGYALILVMVSMIILTILGVTAISVAQMDMKIAQNLRHHRQLVYGALAGQDHAREIFADGAVDLPDTYTAAAQETIVNRCTTDWISSASGAIESPNVLDSNGFSLATYSVAVCAASCGQVAVGNDLDAGKNAQVSSFTLDVVATGTSPAGVSAQATVGGFIYDQIEGSCNGF
jgi:Tfp pilus assembly protein PilX